MFKVKFVSSFVLLFVIALMASKPTLDVNAEEVPVMVIEQGSVSPVITLGGPPVEVSWNDETEEAELVEIVDCERVEETVPEYVSLGTFRVTAYCECRKCNGKWHGYPTASGTGYVQGRTIAVDKHQITLGTSVFIDGHEYTAEDTGSGIGRNCIDIYFDSHAEAKKFGVQYKEVLIKEGE